MSFIPIEAKQPPLPVKLEGGCCEKSGYSLLFGAARARAHSLCPNPNYTHKFMVFKIHLRWSIPGVADSKDTLFFYRYSNRVGCLMIWIF